MQAPNDEKLNSSKLKVFNAKQVQSDFNVYEKSSNRRFWYYAICILTLGFGWLYFRSNSIALKQNEIAVLSNQETGLSKLLPPGRHYLLPWEALVQGKSIDAVTGETKSVRYIFDPVSCQRIEFDDGTKFLTVWEGNGWKLMSNGKLIEVTEQNTYVLDESTVIEYQISMKRHAISKTVTVDTRNNSNLQVTINMEYSLSDLKTALTTITSLPNPKFHNRLDSVVGIEHYIDSHLKTVMAQVFAKYSNHVIAGYEDNELKEIVPHNNIDVVQDSSTRTKLKLRAPEAYAVLQKGWQTSIEEQFKQELKAVGISLYSFDITNHQFLDSHIEQELYGTVRKIHALLAKSTEKEIEEEQAIKAAAFALANVKRDAELEETKAKSQLELAELEKQRAGVEAESAKNRIKSEWEAHRAAFTGMDTNSSEYKCIHKVLDAKIMGAFGVQTLFLANTNHANQQLIPQMLEQFNTLAPDQTITV